MEENPKQDSEKLFAKLAKIVTRKRGHSIKSKQLTFYNAAYEITGNVRGARHARQQNQHIHKHSHEDVFSIESKREWNEPLTEDELNSPLAYTILVIIVLLLSIIGMGVAYELHFWQDQSYKFIYLERSFPKAPAYQMFLACGLGIFTGITGLVIIFGGCPSLFHIFHHSLCMVSAMNLLAALCAMGIRTEPTPGAYHRLFEASTLAMMGDYSYIDIWGKDYRFLWILIQKELKCCGVHGPEDWLRSPLKQIPKSCCSHYHKSQCEARLNIWNYLPETKRKFSDMSYFMNTEGCLNAVRVEWKAMRWDWVVYPIIVCIFHSLTSFNLNLITKVLESQFRTVIGQDIMEEFREFAKSHLKSLCCFPCICCRNLFKTRAELEYEHDAADVVVTIHPHHSTKQSVEQSSDTDTSSGSYTSTTSPIPIVDSKTTRKIRKLKYQKDILRGFY